MFKTIVSVSTVSTLGILTALASGYGCSSSTSNASPDAGNPNNGTDSGPVQTGGDGSTNPQTDSGGSTEHDAGTGATDAGGSEDSGPTGPTCYYDPTGYTALTAAPVPVKQVGACAAGDISTWISSVIDGTATDAWFAANVAGGEADGGGVGTTCGNCIYPPNLDGGAPNNFGPTYTNVWTNSQGD